MIAKVKGCGLELGRAGATDGEGAWTRGMLRRWRGQVGEDIPDGQELEQ